MSQSQALLANLVRFPSISDASNLPLIAFIRAYLADFGITSHLDYNADHSKANLFATIGQGPGGIVLAGHTDVVPVAGQAWSFDPFELSYRDDRLYGRGTCDMKGFVAIALALVPEMLARPLAEPIHLAFTYDEEVGCLGVERLIDFLASVSVRPRLAIVGEPTELRVVTGHKGVFCYRTRFLGVPAHSSQPQRAANAIFAVGRFLAHLEWQAQAARERAGVRDAFSPPWTTFNAGMIQGGQAINIVPGEADLHWEFRPIPSEDTKALEESIRAHIDREARPIFQAEHPQADIIFERLSALPAFTSSACSPAEQLALAITGQNGAQTVAFYTEAAFFQQDGIPTVVCGPGSIDQAHQPDEYITCQQMQAGEAFVRAVIASARKA